MKQEAAKKFAIFPNFSKPEAKTLALGLREFLISHGQRVFAEDKNAKELQAESLSSIDTASLDFLISMGGDGTILRLVQSHPKMIAPIIGINIGSLGFLADIPLSAVYPSLQAILEGKFTIQNRLMLEAHTASDEKLFAVNDIVIHRGKNPSLIDIALHVDGAYLNTFSADGIIVATPSGSTAYSLSSGGPILAPDLDAVVITPICPHTTSCVPIVLKPKNEITIQYLSQNTPAEIIHDGMSTVTLKTDDLLHIKKANRPFSLVSLLSHDYFSTLRTKLNWSGTLKI